ncbi:MAG: phytanoyl-CoA dioxygenase family protein [Armatimonadetes bacterium]|nr:phytanoyl-CoA dioxygenase family protein [Armatimonadota bacterium]
MAVATPSKSDTLPPVLPLERTDRYRVSVEQYIAFRRNGFLVVPGLVSTEEVAELREHTEDLMQGRLPQQSRQMSERDPNKDGGVAVQGLEAPPAHLSPEEKAQYFLRIHMLHRQLELHERYMLHPRVLDVLEVLIGPDVLAMQTMLFLKGPGKPGQGWHQDTFYIPTHPDTLCGAWIAIDDVDELNGAMWMAKGSNVEPVYPPRQGYGHGDVLLENIAHVTGVSDPDDAHNDLSRVADKYDQILVPAKAGDVVFFGGHILHRSKRNFTTDRFRRSFVSHYCNARSFTQWGADAPAGDPHAADRVDPINGMTNGSHILARGDTHLPFALPKFGTPCAATLTPEQRRRESEHAAAMMADMSSGMMDMRPADPDVDHTH